MLTISNRGPIGDPQWLKGADVSLRRSPNQPLYRRNAKYGA